MKKYCMLACLSLCIYSNADVNLPPPYNSLESILPFDNTGWYANAEPMAKIIKEQKVKTVVELGAYMGSSTRHLASILPEDGLVYTVDHWLGSTEHKQNCPEHLPKLYQQFLSNIIHANLTHKIIPLKMTTLEGAKKLQQLEIVPDLVYVDAAHDEQSVYRDLCAYYPFVKGHGILCGDDWSWGDNFPILNAVVRFAKENNLRIEVDQNNCFWVLHKD